MQKKKLTFAIVLCTILLCFSINSFAAGSILKNGMSGQSVTALQKNLKTLGYFSLEPTGYFGNVTANSVKKLQARYGLEVDGIVGSQTSALISSLLRNTSGAASRGTAVRQEKVDSLMPWFGEGENFFKIGDIATIYDIDTGLSFKAKRTYGYNHADCETLTLADTLIIKKIYGQKWSWNRRAVIITVNGRKIAASMAGMPHAGVEGAPANTYVNSRSGGYGSGTNLDSVKNNGMSGHFDIHFLGSKTHGSNKVDENHQAMVKKAAQWIKNN